jgi:hypothetical protein
VHAWNCNDDIVMVGNSVLLCEGSQAIKTCAAIPSSGLPTSLLTLQLYREAMSTAMEQLNLAAASVLGAMSNSIISVAML